jgi:iron complex outermembrane receptor protein
MNSPIKRAVRYALLASAAAASSIHAQDQTPTTETVETIYVTGSAIRRIDAEQSLPVQIFDAEAIERTGAASIVDLMQRLPSIQGATPEAVSIGGSTFGFAGVSVHNVGENRTLVLLNGRRLAQFGGQTLTGFAAAIDLNSIPISAIERVEVLSDGASALYGSDAIAGVVNFITKRSSDGAGVSASFYAPQDDARETGVSVTGGLGDYESDGYSLFFSLAADERAELNAVDRDFADSGSANFYEGGQRWSFFNGSPRNIPGNAIANNPASAYNNEAVSLQFLQDGTCPAGSAPVGAGCYFDYVPHIQIYPERERRTATAALDVKLGDGHRAFADVLWSRAEQVSKTAPVPGELRIPAGSDLFNTYLANVVDENGVPLFIGDTVTSYRALDLGQRINEDKADFYQVLAGVEGLVLGWDYNFAVSQSESDVKGYIAGYPGALGFARVLSSGVIDPFVGPGQQGAEGDAALQSINYEGYWNGGVSQLQTAELRAGRTLFDLPNGNPLQFAVGLSYNNEEFESKPSDFARANLDDPVAGTPAAGGPGSGDQRFGDSSAAIPYRAKREVFGAFTELAAQAADWLELSGSVRFDDYDDVGSTTNYKASFKVTPAERILFRGSYGTGFHAPTVPQLNASLQNYGVTQNPYDCSPELREIASSLGAICRPNQTQYDVFAGGNSELDPEKSRQATLGVVFEASRALSFGMDYWWVGIEDAFGQISEGEAFSNPAQYRDAWTTLTDIGTGATYNAYNQTNINTGKEYYSGLDFNIQGHWETPLGRLRSQVLATHMLTSKVQLSEGGEYFENISDYSNELDSVTFRWSGRVIAALDSGAWSHTLTANFKSGYTDVETEVKGIDANGTLTGETALVRLDVDPYYTLDWQTSFNVTDWARLTIGALNLLDEEPPLSLTTSNFQIGYDARYYDPRGRVLFGRVAFKF